MGSALSDSGPALSEDDAITQSGTYVTPTSFHLHQLLLKHFQTFQTDFNATLVAPIMICFNHVVPPDVRIRRRRQNFIDKHKYVKYRDFHNHHEITIEAREEEEEQEEE